MGQYDRLPDTVVPEHYTLYLKPEFINCTFKGKVSIEVSVLSTAQQIVLNGNKFSHVSLKELRSLQPNLKSQKRRRTSASPESGAKRNKACLDVINSDGSADEGEENESRGELVPDCDSRKEEKSSELTLELQNEADQRDRKASDAEPSNSQPEQSDCEKPKSPQRANDNVIVEKKGLFLLRSEWVEPDEEEDSNQAEEIPSDGSGDEGTEEIPSDGSGSGDEATQPETISSDDEEENTNLIVSSDEGEDITKVDDDDDADDIDNDNSDDDCDVMQVDGADDKDEKEDRVEEDDDVLEVESVDFVRDQEIIVIKPRNEMVPGKYCLTLEFAGKLDDSLRGFYRTKHNVLGEEKWGAACHFEATGARKCFPCFDQPEFRSTFDVSVKRPDPAMEVLSNMPCKEEDEEGICRFERTPRLPTYLVCVILGYYDSISRRLEDGTRISVFTQISQTIQVEFALEVATNALRFYKDFFGQGYTLPKMDLVAVPDFYIGAMENWGLLTFRETALMYHPTASTLLRQQYVAILVCHEIAHQWFGNLVSIAWWDQLWLKEGFATWISFLAVNHLYPHFDIWSDFLTSERLRALVLDSFDSSHPIQVTVNHPGQIDEVFDEISYNKGASIINMLFHWIGEENFKHGLNRYLSEHQNKSAETSDLWMDLDRICNLPDNADINSVMNDWTTQKGYPTIKVYTEEENVFILQEPRENASWKVPIEVILDGSRRKLLLLDEPVKLGFCKGFPLVNVGQTSFCRVQYQSNLLDRLQTTLHQLDSRDRAGILFDLSTAVTGGTEKFENLLDLLNLYAGETEWVVVDNMLEVLHKLGDVVEGTPAWTGFLRMSYRLLESSLLQLGWKSRDGEGSSMFSRSAIIERLGRLGHTETGGEADRLWRRDERGLEEVSKDLRAAVYRTVARNGGEREKEFFLQRFRTADRAEERRLMLTVLSAFTKESIMKELLDWCLTDEVKLQDRVFLIAGVAASCPAGREVTWTFFKDNFTTLKQQYTSGSLLVRLIKGVTLRFNSLEHVNMIKSFFQNNDLPGARRTIEQCLEDVGVLAKRREENKDNLLQFFSQYKGMEQKQVDVRG